MQALGELNDNVIAEIVVAAHAQPSWKACDLDNMTWEGTAEENTKKYLDKAGRQE
jgi:hypothetical protein